MNKVLSILQPLIDHLYIFQLMEYHSFDLLKWFLRHPFKRHLQRKGHIEFTGHMKALLLISLTLITFSSYFLSAGFASFFMFIIIFLQISPLFIVVAEFLFKPLEIFQKGRIVRRAISKREKLANIQVIAIVGSYAKTSTKNMLYTLLWKDFNVVKTPKSYNTEISIARSILNDLKQNTEIFICEMDAYHQGEIATLCQIAQPTTGVITAIGPQHLERFGSIEKLAKTQFELAQFLKSANNTRHSRGSENLQEKETQQTDLRLHSKGTSHFVKAREDDALRKDVALRDAYQRKSITFRSKGLLFLNHKDEWSVKLGKGLDQNILYFNNKEYSVSHISEHEDYQKFTLHLGKEQVEIRLPIKGAHNAGNFLAAAVIAQKFGLSLQTIAKRAKLIQPTEHRLEVRKIGNTTVLDNTYNANPKAALASLALLDSYRNQQRIVITPGFVELGSKHHLEHVHFGKEIAKVADQVIIVGEHAKKPLLEGLTFAKFPSEHIHLVETTAQALGHLANIQKDGAVILLENDLPDQYF